MKLVRRLTTLDRGAPGEPVGTTSLMTVPRFVLPSSAGEAVSIERAYGVAAAWAAMWLIAEQVGCFPLELFRDDGTPDTSSWINDVLNGVNTESTPIDLWGTAALHIESWGNAYIGKEFAPDIGRVVRLWSIPPWTVTPRRVNGQKVFDIIDDAGKVTTYTTRDVLHIKGRSLDGFIGISPIQVHRQTIGLALALDEFGGSTMRNRAVPFGVLKLKKPLAGAQGQETADQMRQEWSDRYQGARRANQVAILDDGAEFEAIAMPLDDAQYVEQRKLSVQDIARIFGVPAELIGGDSGSSMTYANIESRSIELLRYTLRSRINRIEQALYADRDLFPNRRVGKPRFDLTDIYRGDWKTQFEGLSLATGKRQFMTLDEARAQIDLAALPEDSPLHDLAAVPAYMPAPPGP